MITHADIYHFKSISEAHLDFSALNVVVGPNGVGKSNIVDALYFVHDAAAQDLDTAITKRHGIDSIRQWSRTRPFHVVLDFQLSKGSEHGRYRLVIASARKNFSVLEEIGEWYGADPLVIRSDAEDDGSTEAKELKTYHFNRDQTGRVLIWDNNGRSYTDGRQISMPDGELFLTTLGGPFMGLYSFFFRHLYEEFGSFTSYSIYPNTLRNPQVVSREETLFPDGSNLATILRRLNSHRIKRSALISSMQLVLPSLVDIQVRSAGGYYVPILRVREENGDVHDLNMSQVSDGTLRLLGLLAAFYQPVNPEKIAIEEPEQMIHPGILPVIADAAKEFVADSNHQLFLTTHSPPLLDLFEPESIMWANYARGVTDCGRIGKRQLGLIKEQLFSPGEILQSEGFFE